MSMGYTAAKPGEATGMSADNETIVTNLCMGLKGPIEGWLGLLSEDVAYWNTPMAPVQGREAARAFLAPFISDTHNLLETMEILATCSAGDIVMNERREVWGKGDVRVTLPVAGVFRVRDGQITEWRDYWDLAALKPLLDALAA